MQTPTQPTRTHQPQQRNSSKKKRSASALEEPSYKKTDPSLVVQPTKKARRHSPESAPALHPTTVTAFLPVQPPVAAAPNESPFLSTDNTAKASALQSSVQRQQVQMSSTCIGTPCARREKRSASALEEPSLVVPPTPSSVVAEYTSSERRRPPFVRLSDIPVEQRLSSPLFDQLSAYRITHEKNASKAEVEAMKGLVEDLGPDQYGLVCSNLLLENDDNGIRMWQVYAEPSDKNTIIKYEHRRLLFEDDFDLQAHIISDIYRQEQDKKKIRGPQKPTPFMMCVNILRRDFCVLGLKDSRLQRLKDEVWTPLAEADKVAVASAVQTVGKQEEQLHNQKEQLDNMWAFQKKQQELQSEQNQLQSQQKQVDLAKEQNFGLAIAMAAASSRSGTTPQALFTPVNGTTGQDGQQQQQQQQQMLQPPPSPFSTGSNISAGVAHASLSGATSSNNNNNHQYSNSNNNNTNNSTATLQHGAAGSAGSLPGSAGFGQSSTGGIPGSAGLPPQQQRPLPSPSVFHFGSSNGLVPQQPTTGIALAAAAVAGGATTSTMTPTTTTTTTGSLSFGTVAPTPATPAATAGSGGAIGPGAFTFRAAASTPSAGAHQGGFGFGGAAMNNGTPAATAAPAATAGSGGAIGPGGFTFRAAAPAPAAGAGASGFALGGAATNNGTPAATAPVAPATGGGGFSFFGGTTPASATQQQDANDQSMDSDASL